MKRHRQWDQQTNRSTGMSNRVVMSWANSSLDSPDSGHSHTWPGHGGSLEWEWGPFPCGCITIPLQHPGPLTDNFVKCGTPWESSPKCNQQRRVALSVAGKNKVYKQLWSNMQGRIIALSKVNNVVSKQWWEPSHSDRCVRLGHMRGLDLVPVPA